MEVHLSPDVQAKLNRLAHEQGRDTETLAQEAIARFVDDEWFIREVEKGLASADRCELLTHEQVGTRVENPGPTPMWIGLILAGLTYVRAWLVSRHQLGLEAAALRRQLVQTEAAPLA